VRRAFDKGQQDFYGPLLDIKTESVLHTLSTISFSTVSLDGQPAIRGQTLLPINTRPPAISLTEENQPNGFNPLSYIGRSTGGGQWRSVSRCGALMCTKQVPPRQAKAAAVLALCSENLE